MSPEASILIVQQTVAEHFKLDCGEMVRPRILVKIKLSAAIRDSRFSAHLEARNIAICLCEIGRAHV